VQDQGWTRCEKGGKRKLGKKVYRPVPPQCAASLVKNSNLIARLCSRKRYTQDTSIELGSGIKVAAGGQRYFRKILGGLEWTYQLLGAANLKGYFNLPLRSVPNV